MALSKLLSKTAGKVGAKIFTDGIPAPAELVRYRRKICKVCPYLLKATGNCKKCGCFYENKTEYLNEYCDMGKW